MPRLLFSTVQLALVAGIILMGLSIYQKQKDIKEGGLLQPPTVSQPKGGPKRPDRAKPFSHYRSIAQRNLFRTPKADDATKAAIDIENLKPTDLKLKLWGTITGEDGMTRAVIEDQSKRRQALYRAGEEVSSAKVKMILREKVILSVKGEDQILEIQKPSNVSRGPARYASASQPSAPRGRRQPATPVRREVRLKLSRLGPISDNPEDWANYATAAPFQGEDGSGGVVLNRISPSSPLRRLGIRNGDVILNINDQPVSEIETMFQTLAEVSAGEEMSVSFKRRGRERQLNFKFE
jgi:general secretion pathway protein C